MFTFAFHPELHQIVIALIAVTTVLAAYVHDQRHPATITAR
jgi:hypothetical protein